jgi:DNA-binding CsgD family transcriptional regulator/type II secretory pathway predicted ATPase ExeA
MRGSPPPNAAPLMSEWPLVGRESELAEIASALASGDSHGVVIVAGPGVGKTRLAREAAAAAPAKDAMTVSVQGTRSAATVPLAALASVVAADARPDDPVALMRSCGDALRERADGRRVVLVVDDAQLLDPASAALILHLAATDAAFVIATVRAGEPCPDAIVSLWKDDLARRVELRPLGDDQIRELLESALGGTIEEAALRWAADVSRGNAMYVRELVRGAVDSGHLVDEDGFWRLQGQPAANASLIELVQERLSGLSSEANELVELLALGEPITAREAFGLSSEAALLEDEAQGLIETAVGEVRLAHPIYGEAVRMALPPLRAAGLCRQLVAVIEARPNFGPDDALRAARLRLDAGEPLSTELLLQAADAANRVGDPEFGHELASLIPAGEGGLAAALTLARSLAMRNRYAEAQQTLAAVEHQVAEDPDAMEYLRRRLWLYHWGLRDPQAIASTLERARSWRPDEDWQRFVEAVGQRYLRFERDFGTPEQGAALANNQQAPASSRRAGRAAYVMSMLLEGEGDAAAREAFSARPSASDDLGEIGLLGALSLSAVEAGYQWEELEAEMGEVVREGVRRHHHGAVGIAAFTIGRLHFLRGRYVDATRWLAEADSHMRREDPYDVMTHVLVLRVGIAAFSSDFDTTMRALEQLRTHRAQSETLPVARVPVARAEGWAARVRNPTEAGQELLDATVEFDHLLGLVPQLAYDAFRCGAAAAAPLLEALAERNSSRLVSAYAQHAGAKAAADGTLLLAAAEEMAEIGALRYAVEAASDAAAEFVKAGREDSARRAAARAKSLHAPDQGGELPAIDGLDATATALTAREQQLVALASQGLSNAEIADRLVLSVRTVETHLYRAMQKLGIGDRRDL